MKFYKIAIVCVVTFLSIQSIQASEIQNEESVEGEAINTLVYPPFLIPGGDRIPPVYGSGNRGVSPGGPDDGMVGGGQNEYGRDDFTDINDPNERDGLVEINASHKEFCSKFSKSLTEKQREKIQNIYSTSRSERSKLKKEIKLAYNNLKETILTRESSLAKANSAARKVSALRKRLGKNLRRSTFNILYNVINFKQRKPMLECLAAHHHKGKGHSLIHSL